MATQRDSDVLHVVMGESAGGGLRQGLRLGRRKDRITVYGEDLSFGPIDPPDGDIRLAWIGENLYDSRKKNKKPDTRKFAERISAFWDTVLSQSGRRLLWVTRRSACHYAAFLEWQWRLGDKPFEVVDLTDVEVTQHGQPWPIHVLGELAPQCYAEYALWDRAAPLGAPTRERYRAMWQKLREENAPFRVVAGDDLASAPITVHDELLLFCVRDEWRKAAYIAGDIWTAAREREVDVSMFVLLGRMRALVAAGRLELRGNLSALRFGELRLAETC